MRNAAEATTGRVWYLADGVYSMFGGLAPFGVISSLLDEVPNLYVYLDDAHGFSWQGVNGRGSALDAPGIRERLVVSFGLAKSLASPEVASRPPIPVWSISSSCAVHRCHSEARSPRPSWGPESRRRTCTSLPNIPPFGFYLNGAMFPIVPQGHAGIRFTVSLSVSEAQTEQMMTYLARHLRRHGGDSMVIDLREQDRAADS